VNAWLALAAGCVAFACYAASLPPSFAFWDTGELQTVAAILGIAHPPACPAFVLLGWTFAHVLPFGERAWRVDVMCAAAMAASAALLFAVARSFGTGRVTAAICALGFALAAVPWRDATRAEVQDVALVFRVVALAFAFRYARGGTTRDFLAMALATGLAGATHGISVLLLPGLAIAVLSRGLPPARTLALGAAAVALGLSPYAYLPLRSAWIFAHHLDPTVALGLPVGLPFWNYDDPETPRNFLRVLTGADFDVHSGFAGFLQFGRYGDFALALGRRVVGAFGIPGALLAAIGAGAFVARRNACGIALVVVALLPVPYTESYNELQDPDRYYLLSLWCAAIAIGAGFELVLELFRFDARSLSRYAFFAGLVASFASVGPDHAALFAQARDRSAPEYVDEVKALTADDAVVLAEWAYSTPLAYASYVNRTFGDRIVVASSPLQYSNYIGGWLATRPVYLIAFSDDVAIPGFRLRLLKDGPYYVYAISR